MSVFRKGRREAQRGFLRAFAEWTGAAIERNILLWGRLFRFRRGEKETRLTKLCRGNYSSLRNRGTRKRSRSLRHDESSGYLPGRPVLGHVYVSGYEPHSRTLEPGLTHRGARAQFSGGPPAAGRRAPFCAYRQNEGWGYQAKSF